MRFLVKAYNGAFDFIDVEDDFPLLHHRDLDGIRIIVSSHILDISPRLMAVVDRLVANGSKGDTPKVVYRAETLTDVASLVSAGKMFSLAERKFALDRDGAHGQHHPGVRQPVRRQPDLRFARAGQGGGARPDRPGHDEVAWEQAYRNRHHRPSAGAHLLARHAQRRVPGARRPRDVLQAPGGAGGAGIASPG